MASSRYYPVFLDLLDRPCMVVGGGHVACRKVHSLVNAGARVTVVAPEADTEIRNLAAEGRITWNDRPYKPGDLSGAFLVFGATDDMDVNEAVAAEARQAGIPVNIVDVPGLCDVIIPAVVNRGDFQIAISTGGAAPALARTIRKQLEDEFPAWWENYIQTLRDVRGLIREAFPTSIETRRALCERLISGDLASRFAAGETPDAAAIFAALTADGDPLLPESEVHA